MALEEGKFYSQDGVVYRCTRSTGVAVYAALLIANMENIVKQYSTHPVVAMLGVYTDGDIDVDALYKAFAPRFGTEEFPVKLPMVGTIKVGKAEIDKLYHYIKEA